MFGAIPEHQRTPFLTNLQQNSSLTILLAPTCDFLAHTNITFEPKKLHWWWPPRCQRVWGFKSLEKWHSGVGQKRHTRGHVCAWRINIHCKFYHGEQWCSRLFCAKYTHLTYCFWCTLRYWAPRIWGFPMSVYQCSTKTKEKGGWQSASLWPKMHYATWREKKKKLRTRGFEPATTRLRALSSNHYAMAAVCCHQ